MEIRLKEVQRPVDMSESHHLVIGYAGGSTYPLFMFCVVGPWWEEFKRNPEIYIDEGDTTITVQAR